MELSQKRGFFFLIDAVFAISLLVVGSLVLFAAFYVEPSVLQLDALSSSINTFYTTTSFQQVDSPTIDVLRNCTGGPCIVKNPELTFAEQILVLYETNYTNTTLYIQELIKNTTATDLPAQVEMEIRLNNTVIFNTTQMPTDALAVIPAKSVIVYVGENYTVYGPRTFEVLLWQ